MGGSDFKPVLIVDRVGEYIDEQNKLPTQAYVIYDDNFSIDSFGRGRFSEPQTIFDSKNIFADPSLTGNVENLPLFYSNVELSGSGTFTTYNNNKACQILNVSNLVAGKRARQTKMRFNYQPGKSQLIMLTFNMNGRNEGITKRDGLFDEKNGIFLELSDDIYVVKRSYTSGIAVDTKVRQSEWNVDKMDGTGRSGINLDFTKTQIWYCDIEWLGVGRVRIGFVIDGRIYYVHYFNHANILSEVYMSTPNLPIRSEIENDGTGVADSIDIICATVISEGGSEDLGIIRYASTEGTHIDLPAENIAYALLGLKLKPEYIGATIKMLSHSVQLSTASSKCEIFLSFNPTVSGTFTYVNQKHSAVQIAKGSSSNIITDIGIPLSGSFLESGGVQVGSSGSLDKGITNALFLGSDLLGNMDTLILCARPIAGSTNIDVEASLIWREIL